MKKKYPMVMGIVLGMLACVGIALAAGGTSGDPLISLRYLTGTYLPDLLGKVQDRVETGMDSTYQSALHDLNTVAENARNAGKPAGDYTLAQNFVTLRLKKGDAVTGVTGTSAMLLAGGVKVTFSSGAVVNVTDGVTASSGTALTAGGRYLTAENTLAVYTVTSDTAVVSLEGYYKIAYSKATDYNMLADALKTMGLFKGKDLGYGSGYALEDRATRIEGLIMFLRFLGEEDEALACNKSQPFADVPDWCTNYVAYAYDKGYTKGISGTRFGTANLIGASEYVTFLLRSLGYSDSAGDFSWDTALAKAKAFGCLTAGEQTMLSGVTFYRAQMVYVSYYGLSAKLKTGGETLLQKLIHNGAVDQAIAESAMSKVTNIRIS